jgi:hypothetical protein
MKEHASEPFAQLQGSALKFEWSVEAGPVGERGVDNHEVCRSPFAIFSLANKTRRKVTTLMRNGGGHHHQLKSADRNSSLCV